MAPDTPQSAEAPREGSAWSSERIEISSWLERQYPDLEPLYRRAVDELYQDPAVGWPYTVAHCVREIRNRLPDPFLDDPSRFEAEDRLAELRDSWDEHDVLSAADPEKETADVPSPVLEETRRLLMEYDRHESKYKQKATVFFEQAGRTEKDEPGVEPVVKRWSEVTGFFHKHVHVPEQTGERKRDGSEASRAEFISRFEVLEAFLLSFARRFSSVLDRVDDILEEANKAGDADTRLVDEATASLGHGQARRYFFHNLENPAWFGPLRSRGYFDDVPEPRSAQDRDGILHPAWPQTAYLEFLANHGDRQEDVTAVLDELLPSENMTFVQSAAEIAQELPTDEAGQVAGGIVESYDRPDAWMKHGLPEAVLDLAIHVADEDPSAARYMLRRLLWLHEGDDEEEAGGLLPKTSVKSRTPVDEHTYGKILDGIVERFVPIAPIEAIGLIGQRLQDALYRSVTEGHDPPADGSRAWWPRVEEDGSRHPRLMETIALALRDACLSAIQEGHAELEEVLDELTTEEYRWAVFDRICYFLLGRFPKEASPRVEEVLGDPTVYTIFGCPELALLLESSFPELEEDVQTDIVQGFLEGPPAEIVPDNVRKEGKDRVREFSRNWTRDWLHVIEDRLPAEARETLSELEEEEPPADLCRPAVETQGGFRGVDSGVEVEDLEGKDVGEIVTYLNDWTPDESDDLAAAFPGGSEEDLARVFQDHLEENPAKFAGSMDELAELQPAFLRKVFETARTSEEDAFEADEVLELASIALDATEPSEERPMVHLSVRKAVMRYVKDYLTSEPPASRPARRKQVWGVIEQATEDPDPQGDGARWAGQELQNPYTQAINSVRGTSLENVIQYVLWIGRHEGDDGARGVGMQVAPEAKQVLEDHVDHEKDGAAAARSVFGVYLPWLHLVDRAWTAEKLDAIFPEDDEAWYAAWRPYVTHARAYDDLFPLVEEQYRRAAADVDERGPGESPSDYERKLAGHLLTFYGRGLMTLEEGPVGTFFQEARPAVRESAIRFIGTDLSASPEDLPSDVLDRFRQLWNWRKEANLEKTEGGSARELKGFVSWLDIDDYEDEWLLEQFIEVTPHLDLSHRTHRILEYLEETAHHHPEATSSVLEPLIEKATPVNLNLEKERFQTIVSGVASAGANEAAEGIIEELLHEGCLWARDVLEEGG